MPRTRGLSRGDFAKARGFTRLSSASLSLAYGTIPGKAAPGAAVVISKKVAKAAVDRVRFKRVLRPLLSEYLRSGSPFSLIVSVRKHTPAREVREELHTLLGRVPRS